MNAGFFPSGNRDPDELCPLTGGFRNLCPHKTHPGVYPTLPLTHDIYTTSLGCVDCNRGFRN